MVSFVHLRDQKSVLTDSPHYIAEKFCILSEWRDVSKINKEQINREHRHSLCSLFYFQKKKRRNGMGKVLLVVLGAIISIVEVILNEDDE